MNSPSEIQKSLVEVDDSVLVVIDVQDHFLDKYDRLKKQRVVANIVWLLTAAGCLEVPVVAMAEDLDHSGSLNDSVRDALPAGTTIHNKDEFALVDNQEIFAAVQATGRKTAICIGTETDVCVAQSAIRLVGEGYKVMVPRDAVATMDADEEIGLGRMRDAGVAIGSVKALYYEWVRGVSGLVVVKGGPGDLERARPATLAL